MKARLAEGKSKRGQEREVGVWRTGRFWRRMRLALILERENLMWRCLRIGTPNRCEGLAPLRRICSAWRSGCVAAASRRWRWNRSGCTGCRPSRCWSSIQLRPCLVSARHMKNMPGKARMPVDSVPAFGGSAARRLPAGGGDLRGAGADAPSW